MARKPHYATVPLRTAEWLGGLLYFPFYIQLLSVGLAWLLPHLGMEIHTVSGAIAAQCIYFALNFVICLLIFRRFLVASFHTVTKRFAQTVQIVILSVVFCYALNCVVSLVAQLLQRSVVNDNQTVIETLLGHNPALMALCCCVFAPVTEECLMRGLVFGQIHRKSRVLAYAASVLLFAALHVWQTAAYHSVVNTLLVMLQYLPAGIALGWAYERSGTIWTSIFAHMLLNAISCGILIYLK